MSMNHKKIKYQKIESILLQKIRCIYHDKLNCELDNISYKLFDRTLVITIEGIITPPEKLLQKNDCPDLVEQVRKAVDAMIHPRIQNLIEEVLEVKVIDYLSSTTIDNDITGAIAVFEFKPKNS